MRVLLLCLVAVAQQGCDPGQTGSCDNGGSYTNCCLGGGCTAGSQCASGYCSGDSSTNYGACVAAAGGKGLAGYYCAGSGSGDNSLCNSGKCLLSSSAAKYICVGSGTGSALIQAGGYCSTSPDGTTITQAEADSQCASGLVCSGNKCTASSSPTAAPSFAPTLGPTKKGETGYPTPAPASSSSSCGLDASGHVY